MPRISRVPFLFPSPSSEIKSKLETRDLIRRDDEVVQALTVKELEFESLQGSRAVLDRETNHWCHFNGNCLIASTEDWKVQQWRCPSVAQAVASGDKLKWTSGEFVQSLFKKSLLDFAKHRTAQTRHGMRACVKSPEASRLNFFCQTCFNLNSADT